MRPIAIQRSSLRYPLDSVFSSAAHVRLLRVLAHDVEGAVGISGAAQLAGLTQVGARTALHRLEESGIVERVGTGRSQKWALKSGHPLVGALRTLFADEQGRCDLLVGQLRQAVALPELHAAWVDRLPLTPKEPLVVTVVAETKALPWIQEELHSRLAEMEKALDIMIEASAYARADAPSPSSEALILWGGLAAETQPPTSPPRSHAEADARQLRAARVIADFVRSDPSLVQRAQRYVNGLLHEGQGTAARDVGEWRQLLEAYSPERLRDLLVSGTSRAQRLRQSSPFFAILTPEQRDRVLAAMEKNDEA
jgi:hypothetical protein